MNDMANEEKKVKAPKGTHIHFGNIVRFVPNDAYSTHCPVCGKVRVEVR